MRSKTIRVLALIIVLAMIASPVSGLRLNTVEAQGGLPGRNDLVPTGHTPVEKYSLVEADDVVDLAEISRYIVLFEGASLSRAKGGVGINSIEGQNYLNSLAVNRQSVLSKAENLLGRSIEVRYIYDVVLNGVSVELSAQEAKNLEGMPGIRKVLKDRDYTLDTDAGPKWIGADGIWTGSAVPDALGTKGEGVLVGILDSASTLTTPLLATPPQTATFIPGPATIWVFAPQQAVTLITPAPVMINWLAPGATRTTRLPKRLPRKTRTVTVRIQPARLPVTRWTWNSLVFRSPFLASHRTRRSLLMTCAIQPHPAVSARAMILSRLSNRLFWTAWM